jgi:HEPN domain-containing protein
MPAPNPVVAVVQEWLLKADHDLKNAVHTLTLGEDCPTDTVCFHAQQCVEKHIKALLVFQSIPFSKTHDIHAPPKLRPKLEGNVQDRLTRYATVLRYPGAADVSLTEARKAVAIARQVRKEIRRNLPPAALRRKRK